MMRFRFFYAFFCKVPLAKHARSVSGFLQRLRPSDDVQSQLVRPSDMLQPAVFGISSRAGADVVNLMARRVLAGEQTGTRRGAVGRGGIGIREDHSPLGQAIDVRGLIKIRPHVTGVFPAEIV